MHIHILGICGTFMGSIALLAKELGHEVSGADMNIYPPMSIQLEQANIKLVDGYSTTQLTPPPDMIIIGNTLSRGNPCIEYVLDNDLNYTSGPQWLAENVLRGRDVLAVSGTHGKTTTSSIVAWLLENTGRQPGFLIGGVAENFGVSARLGTAAPFVVEADEYDTAFFDKRSKFIHYHPRTLVINNIEYDHADIFADIDAILRQFHHLVRIMPSQGHMLIKQNDNEIAKLLQMGCWTPTISFGIDDGQWTAKALVADFSRFDVSRAGVKVGTVEWDLIGRHNAENALAAIAAADLIVNDPVALCGSLKAFKSVKRRLQRLACVGDVTIYDDFAHHPTAIRMTLEALRDKVDKQRIIAVVEPRSNSMKMGSHKEKLGTALHQADTVLFYKPENLAWDLHMISKELGDKCRIYDNIDEIIEDIQVDIIPGDHVLIMSNGSFQNIHQKLIQRLQS